MKSVTVKLHYCHGIKKLEHTFDFSDDPDGRRRGAIAVYAPNGTMKTSLADTFGDVPEPSRDRYFTDRKSSRTIVDENGTDLSRDNIFVARPYADSFEAEQKTALLVNAEMQKQYDELIRSVDEAETRLLKNLKALSGWKKEDLRRQVSLAFTDTDGTFYGALSQAKDEVEKMEDAPLASIKYEMIFEESVQNLLKEAGFRAALKDYIERYDELLGKSIYFKKGVFNYYHAATIAKTLGDNGFFKANHTVNLKATVSREIKTKEQLLALIDEEKAKLTDDDALRKRLEEINKKLDKNAQLREFREYLHQHLELLPLLMDLDKLKRNLWLSYLRESVELYREVLSKHEQSRNKIQLIKSDATKQESRWEEVVHLFNNRFHVPFTLRIRNKADAVVGAEEILALEFFYKDGEDEVNVNSDGLTDGLSTGEKKARYILNILFEMEERKQTKRDTLFVFDDIADSFDYQNKYAIVQYLKEISEELCFRMLILTHNFDFFRTICERFVGHAHCFVVSKSDDEIKLSKAPDVSNAFVHNLKNGFATDTKKTIACIPFIRNLLDFTLSENDRKNSPNYEKLTSMLHWKDDTPTITCGELDAIFNEQFKPVKNSLNPNQRVMQLLEEATKECLEAMEGINFENKIVLSIAIRIQAERFMVGEITKNKEVPTSKRNQTDALLKQFDRVCKPDKNIREILEDVLLMTPECIHINAFMYEPIIDMSDEHLRGLFKRVKALNPN